MLRGISGPPRWPRRRQSQKLPLGRSSDAGFRIDSTVFDSSAAGFGDGGDTGFQNVSIGAHSVSEVGHGGTLLTDYETSIACFDGLTPVASGAGASLALGELAAGAQVTCTITNSRAPQVKVIKDLEPNSDPGLFDLKIDSTVFDNSAAGFGDGGDTGFQNVSIGAHSVSEVGHGGTLLTDYETSIACFDGLTPVASGAGASLALGELAAGAQVTCTITNSRKPKLIVNKTVVNNAFVGTTVASDFTITVSGTAVPGSPGTTASSSFIDDVNPLFGSVEFTLQPGDYNVDETGLGFFSSSFSGDCFGPIAYGEIKVCNVTNTPLPPSAVTDSRLCYFDRDPGTPQREFRLIFTQDPQNMPFSKQTASNPGQYFYNVVVSGTPGDNVNLTLTIPYPFVTQGARPIHLYDDVTTYQNGPMKRASIQVTSSRRSVTPTSLRWQTIQATGHSHLCITDTPAGTRP